MAEDLEMMVAELSVNTRNLVRQMENASGAFDKRTRQMERSAAAAKKKIEQMLSFDGMKGLAGGLGLALGGREIIGYADKWREAKNALSVVGLQGDALDSTLQALYKSAQDNYAALNPLVEVYKNAAEVQGDLGASSADMLKFTGGVAVGLRAAGTDAQTASGAMLQLGQLLGSGTVRAQEFNSVFNGAMPILQAVAHGMGIAGNSVSELRNRVTAGKISSREFFQSFLKGLPWLEQRAKQAQMTVGQSFTALGNAMVRYFGMAADNQGIEDVLANGVKGLADNFEEVARAATVAAVAIGAGGLLGAVNGLKVGVTALWAVMAENPVGAIIGIVAAATTALYLYAGSVRTAEDALKDEKKAQDDLNQILSEAQKNGGKISKQKMEEAGARHYNARMALEEAVALAKLAEQKANGENWSLKDHFLSGMAYTPDQAKAGAKNPYQEILKKRAADAKAEVAKRQKDLSDLDKRWKNTKLTVVDNPKTATGSGKANTTALTRAQKLADLQKSVTSAEGDLAKARADAAEQMVQGTPGESAAHANTINTDADAQIKTINAQRDVTLTALKKMEKGWKDYAGAVRLANKAADTQVGAVNVKRKADLYDVSSAPFMKTSAVNARESVQGYQDQAANVGLADGALARQQYFQNAINDARRQGIQLTAQDIADLASEADAIGRFADMWDEVSRKQSQAVEIADGFRSALEQIAVNFTSAKSAAAGFLSMLARMAAQEGVETLLGRQGTTLGGKSSGGSGSASAAGAGLISQLIDQIPGFAGGTDDAPGGLSWVGENGKELVNLPAHSQVVPNMQLPDFRASLNSMGQITNHASNIDNRSSIVVQGNADNTTVSLMRAMLAQQDRQMEGRVRGIMAKIQRTQ